MFDTIENLQIITIVSGKSRDSKLQPRKTHAFILRTNGTGHFIIGQNTYTTNRGDLFFLPKGTTYIFKTEPDSGCAYTVINFYADLESPKPAFFSLENFAEAADCMHLLPKLWHLEKPCDKHKCLSLFYALLSYLSAAENVSYAEKKRISLLDPAISYLEDHLFDPALKTEKLHRFCGISDAYFRKLFHAGFGASPKAYVVGKRLAHAKALIDSAAFDSVGEIARTVGYTDPLYFSRAFKKRYGISPQNMNKTL